MTTFFRKPLVLAGLAAATLSVGVATAVLAERGTGRMGEMEGKGGPAAMLLERFDAIDTDKDGKLTQAEIDAYRLAQFAATDANGDGLLNADELSAFHLKAMEDRAKARAAKMLERHDQDGDGQLSKDELAAMGDGRSPFERADADGDGALSKDEVQGALAMMMEHRGHKRGHGMGDGMNDNMGDDN